MPTTYNGIGTRYYGRKNTDKRPGPCPHCGRLVELDSYDTRLWFVVIYIPVVPLGRKRIIDYCPACTRHRVLALNDWETAKQREISTALDRFRDQPTPETAVAAHQVLVGFHQRTEAAELHRMMQTKYAGDIEVQLYLGAVSAHLGEWDESAACFTRALQLQPDRIEARVGLAEAHLHSQRLDEARRLLDFLEKPATAKDHSLAPLESLALAFQQKARHEEALLLFTRLLEAHPDLGQHTVFRKNVEKSERALKRRTSILPRRGFSWKRFLGMDPTGPKSSEPQLTITWRGVAWAGVVVALLVLAAFARNEYVRRHRTLHIVNALPQSAIVNVDGVRQFEVPTGVSELVLAEGRHHATISGPSPEELDFELRSTLFDRWFSDPAWVLNIGGAAILVRTAATYSQNSPPPTYSFHFGHTFDFFPEITHPFTPLPESLQMKQHESRTLTHLDVHAGEAIGVIRYLQSQGNWNEALRLAEVRLRFQSSDDEILQAYVAATRSQRQVDRAEAFLRSGLTNRPIDIEWHRAYQSLTRDSRRDARLAADYDALLQAEPENSALLYLRGRISASRDEARRFFERSAGADPQNPYPLYAQGYDRMAHGDWPAARTFMQAAAALNTNDPTFLRYLFVTRCASGEYATVEQEARDQLRSNPLNFPVVVQLCDVLVAAGKTNDAAAAVTAFEQTATARYGDSARELTKNLRRRLLYETGDFPALEQHAKGDNTPAGRLVTFQALLEQGRVAEAARAKSDLPPEAEDDAALFSLLMVLACTLQGDGNEAQQWRNRALNELEAGDADANRVARLLRSGTPPTREDLDGIVLPAPTMSVVLAHLAHQHPARRAEFAQAARRLNVLHVFPYHLVQRATEPAP